MSTMVSNRRSSFGISCAQCDNELIAPEWTEFRNERQVIHHVWHCSRCDCSFETIVKIKSMEDSRASKDSLPSLLVA